jgi:uncharacterized membrane protein HdeD (DUF308 family)
MSAPSELHSDTSSAAMNGASAPSGTVSAVAPQPTTPPASPAATPTAPTSVETQAAGREIGQWWWAWIVAGIVWIVASFAILRFGGASSVSLVGIVIGVLVLVAGLQDIVVGALSGGWKWLSYIVGGLLLVSGFVMLFNPTKTFLVTASILGAIFLLVGVFWMVEAFATMKMNPLWWLGLLAGMMMIGLGFWASGQFFITQAYSLLVFTGIWALLHGITDIVKAFQIKRVGSLPAADMSAETAQATA